MDFLHHQLTAAERDMLGQVEDGEPGGLQLTATLGRPFEAARRLGQDLPTPRRLEGRSLSWPSVLPALPHSARRPRPGPEAVVVAQLKPGGIKGPSEMSGWEQAASETAGRLLCLAKSVLWDPSGREHPPSPPSGLVGC